MCVKKMETLSPSVDEIFVRGPEIVFFLWIPLVTDLFDAEERNWLFPLFFSFHRRVEGIVTGFGRRRSVRAVTEREAFQRSG